MGTLRVLGGGGGELFEGGGGGGGGGQTRIYGVRWRRKVVVVVIHNLLSIHIAAAENCEMLFIF